MKLVTFTYNDRTRIGELIGDTITVLAWVDSNVRQMIRRNVTPSRTYERIPAAQVKLEAPLNPGKIIAIGRNYVEHAKETGSKVPTEPLIFAKFPSSIIATGDPIQWRPSLTEQVDWEGELGVVIGRKARNVSEDDAYHYVFGYTIANDVTARDLQMIKDTQWTRGKSLDTFCPLGPYLVTKDEIEDPHNLAIRTMINDELVQDGSTRDMIFSIPHLIAYCSRMFTLEPGDLLMTGTPPGVGVGRSPQRFLQDGEVVTVSIEGIGEISNPCQVIAEETVTEGSEANSEN